MSATPLTPAERFARIIATLLAMVGARLERPGKPGLAGPLTLAITIRLERIRNRITRYVARWQAGTLTPPRPRPATARVRNRGAGRWDHLPKLPRGRLWLVRLVPEIGVGANHLRILLDDPEMAAMMQAAPQIGRTLRPFWHMLSNQPLPPLLQRPRPAPRPTAPPTLTRRAKARPVDPLRGSPPQAGEEKSARRRPLSRLRERVEMRADQAPQPHQEPPSVPDVAPALAPPGLSTA
jgi:hypothetical protein